MLDNPSDHLDDFLEFTAHVSLAVQQFYIGTELHASGLPLYELHYWERILFEQGLCYVASTDRFRALELFYLLGSTAVYSVSPSKWFAVFTAFLGIRFHLVHCTTACFDGTVSGSELHFFNS